MAGSQTAARGITWEYRRYTTCRISRDLLFSGGAGNLNYMIDTFLNWKRVKIKMQKCFRRQFLHNLILF